MTEGIYKVILKENNDLDEKTPNLIFKSTISAKKLNITADFILNLKKLTAMKQNYVIFQNISQVMKIDKEPSLLSYNYYYLILYTLKNGIREGFLIGNEKNSGDSLIGTWPFNIESVEFTSEQIINKLNNLIENPEDYENVLIISN